MQREIIACWTRAHRARPFQTGLPSLGLVSSAATDASGWRDWADAPSARSLDATQPSAEADDERAANPWESPARERQAQVGSTRGDVQRTQQQHRKRERSRTRKLAKSCAQDAGKGAEIDVCHWDHRWMCMRSAG